MPICVQVLKRCTSAGAPHLGSSVPRKYLGDFSIMVPSRHFLINLQVLERTLMAGLKIPVPPAYDHDMGISVGAFKLSSR